MVLEGSGKNGQQLLEETRVSGLIDSSKFCFVITAETSRDMVMGAVAYQPDAYLAKPFTPISLLDRLIATMKTRQEFSAIYKAFRQEQYEMASCGFTPQRTNASMTVASL